MKPLPPVTSPSAFPREDATELASNFGAYSLSSPNARSPNAMPSRSQSPASRYPSSSPHITSPALSEPLYPPRSDKPLSLSPVPDARERAAARSEERRKREELANLGTSSPDPSPSPGSKAIFDDGRLDRLSPRPVSDSGSPSLGAVVEDKRGNTSTPRSPAFSPEIGGSAAIGLGVGPVAGLGLPTGRADKRRSINPAMILNYQDHQPNPETAPSPSHPSFINQPVDTLSVTRGSPLPPSPLRSSFSDGRANPASSNRSGSPMVNTALSPIPNRLYGSGMKEPSRNDLSTIAQDETMTSSTPPRSSSLADALHAATAFPSNSRPPMSRESSRTFSPALSRDGTFSNSAKTLVPGEADTVRTAPPTGAPELPSLDFSASNSDFAMILEETDTVAAQKVADTPKRPGLLPHTGNSLQRGRAPVSRVQPLNLPMKEGSSRSLPNSPAYPAHIGANASTNPVNNIAGWMETPSSEMSDPFYSPDPASKVAADSQESASSATDRDGSWQLHHESALPQLQAVLADTQQYNNTVTQIDIALLDKAIKEIVELNTKVKIFSQKYSGAKVCAFFFRSTSPSSY